MNKVFRVELFPFTFILVFMRLNIPLRACCLMLLPVLQACSVLPSEHTTKPEDTNLIQLAQITIPSQGKPSQGKPSQEQASPGQDQTESQWHEIIQSEQLDQLIAEVLVHNKDLQATASRLLVARKQVEIASGERLPELDLSLDGSRQRNALGTTGNHTTGNQFSAGLNLSWELDVWGRLSDAEQVALFTAEQQQALYQAAKLSLAGQVASDWIAAIEAKRQYALAQTRQQSLAASLEVIEDGFQVGIRQALDVYSARAEWINGKTEILERKQAVNDQLRALSLLLGRYPSLLSDIPDQLPDSLVALDALDENLSSSLLERRPDVQAAYQAVQSQQSNVLVAGSNRLPRFTLTARTGASSEHLSDVLRGDDFIWNALGGITAPIFNAGRLAAEEQRQQHLLAAAIADFRQTALTAFAEVEQGIDHDHFIVLGLASASAAVEVSQQAEQQAFESYLAGLENLNTWLQAQRSAFERSSRLMQLEARYFQNRIQLHQALGGDFKDEQNKP